MGINGVSVMPLLENLHTAIIIEIPDIRLKEKLYIGTEQKLSQGLWLQYFSKDRKQAIVAGHRYDQITRAGPFYNLQNLISSDVILLTYGQNVYKFAVTTVDRYVDEGDVNILNEKRTNTLILYTCSYANSRYRTVVVAELHDL